MRSTMSAMLSGLPRLGVELQANGTAACCEVAESSFEVPNQARTR